MPRGPVRRGHPLLRGALSGTPPNAVTRSEPASTEPASTGPASTDTAPTDMHITHAAPADPPAVAVNGRRPGEQPRHPPGAQLAVQLSQLAMLRQQALLSEDEYETARARLLDT